MRSAVNDLLQVAQRVAASDSTSIDTLLALPL